jgi:hypothetical protein
MTYIYSIENDDSGSGSGSDYFATKKEAMQEGRQVASGSYYPVEITRSTVRDLPRRELLVALLMCEGWLMEDEVIATFAPGLEIKEILE